MFAPAVYATPTGLPVPVPVTLKVEAPVKVMVTGCSRLVLGGAGGLIVPAVTAPLPVFAPAAAVRIGAAAAISTTSSIASAKSRAAVRVGLIRKLSPAAGAPAPEIVMPSTVCGSAA